MCKYVKTLVITWSREHFRSLEIFLEKMKRRQTDANSLCKRWANCKRVSAKKFPELRLRNEKKQREWKPTKSARGEKDILRPCGSRGL